VGKINEKENPVNHIVAQGDEGVETSPLEGIDNILQKHG
jgi:hypothetical protein